jgi:predicted nucleic acid-binding protein
VPRFNVEPFCHALASRAAPAGDKDICLAEEREAREQLVQQWSATTGGDPTYTELLTCLELQRDARTLREKQEGTTAISPRSR